MDRSWIKAPFAKMLRERERARAFGRLDLTGTLSEPGFDRFVEEAANAFAAPISFLTLIHDETIWVRASAGLDLRCLRRQDSFCTNAIDRDAPFEVCDALSDDRVRSLPAVVDEPRVRYYLGASLRLLDGTGVGALCVVDTRPRPPASRDQRAYLLGLARQAAHALERKAHVRGCAAA